jgi:hypothetical protein
MMGLGALLFTTVISSFVLGVTLGYIIWGEG